MADATDDEALTAEIDRLAAQRDALAAEVAHLDRRVHGGRPRRVLVGALVVVTSLCFLVASGGWWANRNLLDTDVWVERVGPLATDPAVQRALAAEITDQVMATIDPEALFESALPERGQVLAGPLSGAVESFVSKVVDDFVRSDAFAELWVRLNRTGHHDAVAVLRGEDPSPLVDVSQGKVSVSIIPAIDAVLARLSQVSPEILGRSVTLPKLTVEDLPAGARDALAQALGITLDDDFGTLTVYDGDALSTSQRAIELFDRLLVPASVLTVLLVPLTLWLSRRRRRTAMALLVGFALALVLLRRLALRLVDDVVDLAQIPGNQAALSSILHAFADPLFTATSWILGGLALVWAVLLLTGPSRWATSLRRGIGEVGRATVAVAGDDARRNTAVGWIRDHVVALRWAVGVLAVAALWWLDLSWLGLVVLALAAGAALLWLARLAEAGDDRPRHRGRDLEQAQVRGPGHRGVAVVDVQLAVDVAEVGLHGVDRDEELTGDVGVAEARGQVLQDAALPLGQRFDQPR